MEGYCEECAVLLEYLHLFLSQIHSFCISFISGIRYKIIGTFYPRNSIVKRVGYIIKMEGEQEYRTAKIRVALIFLNLLYLRLRNIFRRSHGVNSKINPISTISSRKKYLMCNEWNTELNLNLSVKISVI